MEIFAKNEAVNKLNDLDQAIILFDCQNKYVEDLGNHDCHIIADLLKELKELREKKEIMDIICEDEDIQEKD